MLGQASGCLGAARSDECPRPGDPRTDELVAMLVSALDHREESASVWTDGAIFAQYFDSGPRTDAMVLLALVHARPGTPRWSPWPTAQIESGTLLALDVTVTMDAALPCIAVDTPLPAGLEAIDTSVGKGWRAMVLKGTRGWWASHEEIGSDRALLFVDRLPAGAHTHTIYLRATTPGRFEMPPTVAQSMYFPEVSGHPARRSIDVAGLSVSSP